MLSLISRRFWTPSRCAARVALTSASPLPRTAWASLAHQTHRPPGSRVISGARRPACEEWQNVWKEVRKAAGRYSTIALRFILPPEWKRRKNRRSALIPEKPWKSNCPEHETLCYFYPSVIAKRYFYVRLSKVAKYRTMIGNSLCNYPLVKWLSCSLELKERADIIKTVNSLMP